MNSSAHDLGNYCLHAFSQQVPASLAAFYRVDEQLLACDFQLLGMQPPMHHRYLQHYRDLDPLKPDNCQAIGLPVVSLRQALVHHDPAEGHEYLGFLAHHQVVDVVEIVARVEGRPAVGVSLLRDGSLGAFSPAELERLLPLHGLMQMAAQQLPVALPDRLAGLTPREREVALLLQNGACNKTLARQLGLGLPTVKTHLINLFRKVGVRNRTELIGALFL